MNHSIVKEQKKYLDIYDSTMDYGSGNHGKFSHDTVLAIKPNSVLDIGCGNGEFCKWIYDNVCNTVYGLDFASKPTLYGPKLISEFSHTLPFDDNSIDLITCFDALEHIPEKYVDLTLIEIKRVVTKYCIFNIGYFPSTKTGINGENLHITLNPHEWWVDKLKFHFPNFTMEVIYKEIPNSEKKYTYIILKR